MTQERGVPVVGDPCLVLASFAGLLAESAPLGRALDTLAHGLGLRSVVVRSLAGDVLGVGGEALQAVSHLRPVEASQELPVPGHGGVAVGSLRVLGAKPSLLPALRAAAAVLGMALVPALPAVELLEAAEQERDELADALHDGPVQSLVVARYAADSAVRGGDAVAARDAVQQALVETRRALWNLRPRGGDGLHAALDQLSAQLTAAGASPLTLRAAADLDGAQGVLAFRLVQAVAGTEPVRVGVRAQDGSVVVDVDGGTLPSPERWVGRARALGGDLSSSAGRLRLVRPVPPTTDARIAP